MLKEKEDLIRRLREDLHLHQVNRERDDARPKGDLYVDLNASGHGEETMLLHHLYHLVVEEHLLLVEHRVVVAVEMVEAEVVAAAVEVIDGEEGEMIVEMTLSKEGIIEEDVVTMMIAMKNRRRQPCNKFSRRPR